MKEHVADKERRDAILDVGKELEDDLASLREEIEDHFNYLVRVHGKYESTTEDYVAAGRDLMSDQHKLATLVLDARDEMKKHTTRAEWEAIFAKPEADN